MKIEASDAFILPFSFLSIVFPLCDHQVVSCDSSNTSDIFKVSFIIGFKGLVKYCLNSFLEYIVTSHMAYYMWLSSSQLDNLSILKKMTFLNDNLYKLVAFSHFRDWGCMLMCIFPQDLRSPCVL